jgi:hypothetical protein
VALSLETSCSNSSIVTSPFTRSSPSRGGHDLVRALRDCGALERMLRSALGAPERATAREAQPALEFRRFS